MTFLTGCLDTHAPDSSSDPNHFKTPSLHPGSCLVSKPSLCLLSALSPWSVHRTLPPIKLHQIPCCCQCWVLSTSHFLLYPLLTSQGEIWVSRCLLKTGWRKRGGRWIICDLRDSATAAGEPPWRGSSVHHSPGPPSILTAALTAKPSWAFRSPLVCSKKPVFCDTSQKCLLHFLAWQTLLSTGFVFQPLHLKAAHIKSSNFIHTLDEVGNQSVVKSTSPGKQCKKKTPSIITNLAHDKELRENPQEHSKPTSSFAGTAESQGW